MGIIQFRQYCHPTILNIILSMVLTVLYCMYTRGMGYWILGSNQCGHRQMRRLIPCLGIIHTYRENFRYAHSKSRKDMRLVWVTRPPNEYELLHTVARVLRIVPVVWCVMFNQGHERQHRICSRLQLGGGKGCCCRQNAEGSSGGGKAESYCGSWKPLHIHEFMVHDNKWYTCFITLTVNTANTQYPARYVQYIGTMYRFSITSVTAPKILGTVQYRQYRHPRY